MNDLKSSTPIALLSTALLFGNASAAVWQKTPLALTGSLTDEYGFPLLDEFGDPMPALPSGYAPSFYKNSNGLQFLRVDYETELDPPIIDGNGFSVWGDFYQLSSVTLASSVWSASGPLTDFAAETNTPSLVSRLDDTVSVAHWKGELLYIDTLTSPANVRITLPIAKRFGDVAIDANEGVHVLVVNAKYELWHYYFADDDLSSTKLSDGPVCQVVAVAGEGDECHVAYSTFSEDLNLNEVLDDGEDLNGNNLLDNTPMQLVYQAVGGTTPSPVELIDDNTLLKLCAFDLHYSVAHGLMVAYSDPVYNAVRYSERTAASWPSVKVSTVVDVFESIALAVDSAGAVAVSYVSADGTQLYVSEEYSSVWSETLIAQSTSGDYFTGTDAAFDGADGLVVLTSEKARNYLNAYSRSTIPDLLSAQIRPIEIRSAFVVTWPTPSEGVIEQILQSNADLSDPEGWQFVAQRYVNGSLSGTMESTVEHDAPNRFYRVVELSE